MLPVRKFQNRQRGITLIEILVTMIILAIGLLGLAGLMMDGLKNNQSAYLRTQASILAYDMADRIRINRDRAIAGDYDGYSTSGDSGVTNLPACVGNADGCSAADQVNLDLAEWTREIQGAGGTALLPDGEGSITRGAGNLFTITVGWQETQWDEESEARATDLQQFAVEFSL
ncbi:MAG: type IV pilus modification protein PilV [Pseudomonadota bacterium]